MIEELKQSLWQQFGASIEMLSNVISGCPDEYLLKRKRFYYIAYHTALLLDYYLTLPPKDFNPVLPFTIKNERERPEESVGDMIPDKVYTKKELLDYIQLSYKKCRRIIEHLTEEKLNERFTEDFETDAMDFSIVEILLYNIRHVQHHTAQLNLLVRQDLNKHTEWISRNDDFEKNN